MLVSLVTFMISFLSYLYKYHQINTSSHFYCHHLIIIDKTSKHLSQNKYADVIYNKSISAEMPKIHKALRILSIIINLKWKQHH